jgi:acetyl esterase/lipase
MEVNMSAGPKSFLVLFTLFICLTSSKISGQVPPASEDYVLDQGAIETDGVVYRREGGRSLMMDIERPQPSGVARPALVFLCGNGWGEFKSINRAEFSFGLDLAVAHGYVGATVDYSSIQETLYKLPVGKFPQHLYDVKNAIRFLRANAKRFDIDPTRIAVVGQSSGGNLALLLGLTQPSDGLEGDGEYMDVLSLVSAVVNFAGPTDLLFYHEEMTYIGVKPETDRGAYQRASPISYARPDAPPILSIWGDQDNEVSIEEAYAFDKRMKEVGADHNLVVKNGGGHMDFELDDPVVWDFLKRVLR